MRKLLQFEEDISDLETGTKLDLEGEVSSVACFGFFAALFETLSFKSCLSDRQQSLWSVRLAFIWGEENTIGIFYIFTELSLL